MVKVDNVRVPVLDGEKNLIKKVAKSIGVDVSRILAHEVLKKSIDARDKSNILFVYSLLVTIDNEKSFEQYTPYVYKIPKITQNSSKRPVIIGSGPAGTFCALVLARAGLNPLIVERGKPVEQRTVDVKNFCVGEKLNSESNIQFGEGGAGTFSDGKLTTGIKDERIRFVLETLAQFGAPKEILYSAKPHIGTDFLKKVTKNLREEITNLGGEYLFDTKFVDFAENTQKIKSVFVQTEQKQYTILADDVVLAIGHSARDTLEMLSKKGVKMKPKSFAVGVRIEHLQKMLNEAQYGKFADILPPADYKLTYKAKNGRGVYSFCVCPGGEVAAASSEEARLCVNGMSDFARDGENINGALLVTVNPDDFAEFGKYPLNGVEFQRNLEKKAFELGGGNYHAPVQYLANFIQNHKSKEKCKITPSYPRGVKETDLWKILEGFIGESISESLPYFDKKIKGFSNGGAILTAIETRSSSPVVIERNTDFQSISVEGLYLCGEGAGYAGGIMSSAVDGIKCAEKIIEKNGKEAG